MAVWVLQNCVAGREEYYITHFMCIYALSMLLQVSVGLHCYHLYPVATMSYSHLQKLFGTLWGVWRIFVLRVWKTKEPRSAQNTCTDLFHSSALQILQRHPALHGLSCDQSIVGHDPIYRQQAASACLTDYVAYFTKTSSLLAHCSRFKDIRKACFSLKTQIQDCHEIVTMRSASFKPLMITYKYP